MLVRLMLSAVLAAGLAAAQGGGRGGGGGDDGMPGGGGGGMGSGMEGGGGMPRAAQRQTKAEIFMDKLKLKDAQKEEAVKILMETAKKASPVAEQLSRGRQMIGTAILQKKSDEEIKQLTDLYSKISAQMTALEAEAFGKIYETLKPNQQKNAAQQFELLAGMFMPQAAGGRGMGRGQGGGQGGGQGRGGGRN
jgi:hypothetical protein